MKTLFCGRAQRLISRQMDAPLLEKEASWLEGHLIGCMNCRKFATETVSQRSGLGMIVNGNNIPPPGMLTERAFDAWEAERSMPRFGRIPSWVIPVASLATAGAAVWAGLTFIVLPSQNRMMPVPLASTVAVATPKPGASPAEKPILSTPAPVEVTTTQPVGLPKMVEGIAPHLPTRKPGVARKHRPTLLPPATNVVKDPVLIAKDDLDYVNNDSERFALRWTHLPKSELEKLEARIRASVKNGDDFVDVPFPLVASTDPAATRSALAVYRHELQVTDARLQRKVTLGEKRLSFADLCEKLKTETGIDFSAAKGVADDKITIFCKDRPLRDIMRSVSELFNYTWDRQGEEGAYTYRLKQSLKAQLLEEELRNRDRNEALLGLDREMEKYKPYLNLTPEEAKKRAESATGEEKRILDNLAGSGWGPAQLYNSLSPQDLDALRNGQPVVFSNNPRPGELALPPQMMSGMFSAMDNLGQKVAVDSRGRPVALYNNGNKPPEGTREMPASQFPNASVMARLDLNGADLGRLRLQGNSGIGLHWSDGKNDVSDMSSTIGNPLAVGSSPSTQSPENAKANDALKNEPEMKEPAQVAIKALGEAELRRGEKQPYLTTADVLEALHKATGQDVIGDYFTRLYPTDVVPGGKIPLFELLNQVSDKMNLRWGKQDNWLTFRSTSFFNDRLKEVPNRLLDAWTATRKKQDDSLTLNNLIDMTRNLTDIQLNATEMGRGIRAIYGLEEWDIVTYPNLRSSWRMLGALPKHLVGAAATENGISFDQLPLLQQQQFILTAYGPQTEEPVTQADVAVAAFRVEYKPATTQPTADGKNTEHKPADLKFRYVFGPPTEGQNELTLGAGSTSRNVKNKSNAPRVIPPIQ